MFTGVDLNAYEIRSPSQASRTGGSIRSCEAEGSRSRRSSWLGCGPTWTPRPLAPRRSSRLGWAVGLEGAAQHLPGAVLHVGDAVPALSPLHPRRTGHGLLGEPEPAREARRRRARRRAAEGEEARPVDRALEPGQRGGSRLWRGQLGDRYLRVRFEDLCAEPAENVRRIYDFFGLRGDAEAAATAVRPPDTLGRWRKRQKEWWKRSTAPPSPALARFGYL